MKSPNSSSEGLSDDIVDEVVALGGFVRSKLKAFCNAV